MSDHNDLSILDGRRMGAAVYAVEHLPTGKRLICGTICLSKRLSDQRRYLRRLPHHNPELTADIERDGADSYRFVILELVSDPLTLPQRRRHFINEARGLGLCYNVDQTVRSGIWVAPSVLSAECRGSTKPKP